MTEKPLPRVSVRVTLLALLGITVLSVITLYITPTTSSVLMMAAAFTLAFSLALYAFLQTHRGAGYIPLLVVGVM
ncbi:MAG: hypothetical protein EOP83_03645 [Verrucomicrobiaceae bacterium]|nr:MAG: hypothetical protein EOP83_03645 [Verrucomicrobiaceae bacterium]